MSAFPLPAWPPLVFFGHPIDTEGMAGTIDVSLSDTHNIFEPAPVVAVLIEQDLRPTVNGRYACWTTMPRSTLADGWFVEGAVASVQFVIDRYLRPWTQEDSWKGWPEAWTPFPTVDAAGRNLGRLVAFCRRAWKRIR